MSARTSIEWTHISWNPVSGCDKVSPGCDHCYAETIATRFAGTKAYPNGFGVTLKPDRLADPLRKRSWRGKRVFVNSMSDLFHKEVPDSYIAEVFAVMALAPDVTFQLLTKRHGRMRSLLNSDAFFGRVVLAMSSYVAALAPTLDDAVAPTWTLPNVWLGVSVEDQRRADLRIPALLDTPAAVRWLSCEPLLGPLDLSPWVNHAPGCGAAGAPPWCICDNPPKVDWVVVGGESGRGARPMHPDWARALRSQCVAAGVSFLFKQWGEYRPVQPGDVIPDSRLVMVDRAPKAHDIDGNYPRAMLRVGKKAAGRELDGRTWDEYPEARP